MNEISAAEEDAVQQSEQTIHNHLSMTGTSIPDNINSSSNGICTRSSSNSSASTTSTTANIPYSGGGCLPLSNDARLEFITSYTLTSLRLKHDKWHKMMATQEYQVKLCIFMYKNYSPRSTPTM